LADPPLNADILVHAEKIFWVLSPRDFGQAVVVCAIGTTDTTGFLLGHVVHIDRSRGTRASDNSRAHAIHASSSNMSDQRA
jgi:hypothetical protein